MNRTPAEPIEVPSHVVRSRQGSADGPVGVVGARDAFNGSSGLLHAIPVGTRVRVAATVRRHRGEVGTVVALNPCQPGRDNASVPVCMTPHLHDEIAVSIGGRWLWFNPTELEVAA